MCNLPHFRTFSHSCFRSCLQSSPLCFIHSLPYSALQKFCIAAFCMSGILFHISHSVFLNSSFQSFHNFLLLLPKKVFLCNPRFPSTFPKMMQLISDMLSDHRRAPIFILLLLAGEALLSTLIVLKVPYTEIDWIAYMQEVGEEDGFLSGQRNYSLMKGDTGPLVYPAGFVYLYSALYYITARGKEILLAQYIFIGVYVLFMAVVFKIYSAAAKTPPWLMLVLVLSRRIHSLFMLRLFNDCFAMLFLYLAVFLFIKNRWTLGCISFSFAVSVKMNVLLFAPGLLLVLWRRFGFLRTIPKLAVCATLQIALALPFLLTFPMEYFAGAFNFGRQFMYQWTVNLKFLDEKVFLDKKLSLGLLACHLVVLFLVLNKLEPGGLRGAWRDSWETSPVHRTKNSVTADYLVKMLFASNFVGIMFSRSLHYQFYVCSYFHPRLHRVGVECIPCYSHILFCIVGLPCLNFVGSVLIFYLTKGVS
eukprot:g26966.t1